LDADDGFIVYDVEFYSGNLEYDYEISAVSGDILEYDHELEYHQAKESSTTVTKTEKAPEAAAASSTSQYIGTAKAKSIALNAAGLTASQVRDFSVELDRENRKMVYEVEFESGRMEYEYEIDAVSGKILKSKREYDD
jgi:uncharacterized membrane protein YkoI